MPFLFIETAQALVAESVIDFCMIGKPEAGDVLSACRDVCRWVAEDGAANRGAMFGGLLCLGDARVMELLNELKWTLTEDQVGAAARSASSMPTIAGVEFWLSWIEELVYHRPQQSSLLGHVASGLCLLERHRGIDTFHAIERNFGYAASPRSASGGSKKSLRVLEELTLSKVAARYAERMYALEAAEAPLKLMSMVLLCFGLEPSEEVNQESGLRGAPCERC